MSSTRHSSRWRGGGPTEIRAAAASGGGSSARTAGSLASSNWLRAIGSTPPTGQRWHVELALGTSATRPTTDYDDRTETRFQLGIYSEEWGFFFCHERQCSWIRVTDVPFVHGRDDYHLLSLTPALKDVGALVRRLEEHHALRFDRSHPAIKTNVAGLESLVATWIARL